MEDNGIGISKQDFERIFEPLFSRKVLGRSGIGLSLTVVWNTVREHDGYIHVTSGSGGAVFECYLPASAKLALRTNERPCGAGQHMRLATPQSALIHSCRTDSPALRLMLYDPDFVRNLSSQKGAPWI